MEKPEECKGGMYGGERKGPETVARPLCPETHKFTPLAELVPLPNVSVDVCAAIRAVVDQGHVACRKGAPVSLVLVKLADESDPAGTTTLKLWGRKAEWAKDVLTAGDVVLLIHGECVLPP